MWYLLESKQEMMTCARLSKRRKKEKKNKELLEIKTLNTIEDVIEKHITKIYGT
jgi:hypothetical protein